MQKIIVIFAIHIAVESKRYSTLKLTQTMNNHIESMLTEHSVKPSPIRILVLKEIAAAKNPVSSLDLEHRLITVDRSSITRALSTFVNASLVHAIDDGSGSTKYELCTGGDGVHGDTDLHPHFHCIRCGETYCLTESEIPPVSLPEGFQKITANYVIKGICKKCR